MKAILGLCLLSAITACSTVPVARPPRADARSVEADFWTPPDGRIPVPSSSPTLVVFELSAEPPARGEEFRDGQRYLRVEPGIAVTVRCRYRAYADEEGRIAAPEVLFPTARTIRVLP